MDSKDQNDQNIPFFESQPDSKREAFAGKWMRFNYIDYNLRGKEVKDYEMVERTTRKGLIDGVDVISLVSYADNPVKKVIFIANFRYPVGKYVLEFPAGLLEEKDNLMEDAFRELKEETGYTANKLLEVKNIPTLPVMSPILYNDPWKSNENGKCVIVEVDGDDEANQELKQDLDDEENIKVHLLDLTANLVNDLEKLAKENNYLIEIRTYMFAWGIGFGKSDIF